MKSISFLLICLSLPLSIQAKTIAGINIPNTVSHSEQSTKLILNGVGMRTKFVFDIYIGSLYLETKQTSANTVYTSPGEKRISMHFLYDKIEKGKLVSGWNEGFKNNNSKKELEKFNKQINQFNSFFDDVKKGDVININFIPTTGTQVIINDKSRGLIEGDDFFVILLKIWLGEEPADDELKEAMLGK